MNRIVHIPYVLERAEGDMWCAHAVLRPRVGAHGEGTTPEEAIADLQEALIGLIQEFGPPLEVSLTVTVDQ
ncbi:type II toxin-antitoxin system HicB family antitoxin [Nonomuraea glycinis]|uniref:type II toxin-antitoxin system HicB family antitoxin n=1 Tax=Nonomuraea glycinis TaxID=2047744 RepID=UPI0033B46B92